MKINNVSCVLILSWWLFLLFSTQLSISYDSESYNKIANNIIKEGLPGYFNNEPRREPVYPIFVSSSIVISKYIKIDYKKVITSLQLLVLLSTLIIMYHIMNKIGIRSNISWLVILYAGISPAIVNSALSMYSEIIVYPFILLFIFYSRSVIISSLSSVLLIFTKGIFLVISPVHLILTSKNKAIISIAIVSIILCSYQVICYSYKKNISFMDRAPWAFCGNTERRMMPLTPQRIIAAVSSVPGEGVCRAVSSKEDCYFWSFGKSDILANYKLANFSSKEMMITSFKEIISNPVQYIFLYFLESLKLFFWESTHMGFVSYPKILSDIYDNEFISNGLRMVVSVLTIFSFVYSAFSRNPIIRNIVIFISLYAAFHSFFFILSRYALPIAPLFLILIGYSAGELYGRFKELATS